MSLKESKGRGRYVGSFGGRKEKDKITSKYKRNNFLMYLIRHESESKADSLSKQGTFRWDHICQWMYPLIATVLSNQDLLTVSFAIS